MRFRTETERTAGGVVHSLHDDQTGAVAQILPDRGFNLFALRLPLDGSAVPVLHADPKFADGAGKPTRSGCPVLFPFPNRIRDARFQFEGREYILPANKPPHAIHGFAFDAPWSVEDFGANELGAWIKGGYQISLQTPEAARFWPADARLELTYLLGPSGLTLDAGVGNPSSVPLPFGFGLHSYFKLPTPAGRAPRVRVSIPANRYWIVHDSIPTGETRPVDDRLDFRMGKVLGAESYDDNLTDLQPNSDGRLRCVVSDADSGRALTLECEPPIREIVIFTPPGTPGVVAIEPYTMAADAIRLEARGVHAGLITLKPGDRAKWRIWLKLGAL